MKEINGQLYGYSYELRTPTTEDDLTTCFAVDTGEVFVAYGGIWYAQRNVHWANGGSGGGGGGGGGSDSGVLVVTVNGSGPYSLDKTAGEIFAACQAKKLVVVYDSYAENAGTFSTIVEYDVDESGYYTFKARGDSSASFYANSADGYPATQS